MTPYFISYLGAESYGLVAFFSLLTTWMNLFDLGMTPTLGREVASSRGSKNSMTEFKKLLRSFEIIFLVIGLIAFLTILYFRNWLSTEWINPITLSRIEIAKCIVIMGAMVGIRWYSTLYRSILIGFEYQIILNLVNIFFYTMKFVVVVLLFKFYSTNVLIFFQYQFFWSVLEALVLMITVYKKLPESVIRVPLLSFYWPNIKKVMPFSLSIAYTSIIWIFVSQVDKLVLSGVLNLKEFGFFNLVIMLVTTISLLVAPIIQTVLPRMVYLYSLNEISNLRELYKSASQIVTLIAITSAMILALYSKQIVYGWTNNIEAANWTKDVLFWYSLGGGILTILGFQYYLQVAFGKLKLNVIGGNFSLLIDVPIIIFISYKYGANAAGMFWFCLRTLWLIFWTPIVHNKFIPGMHFKWMINDVLKIIAVVTSIAFAFKILVPLKFNEGYKVLFNIGIIGFGILLFSSLSSSFIRKKLLTIAIYVYRGFK